MQDEEITPRYRADSQDSVPREFAASEDVTRAADLVLREINHTGPRPVLKRVSSVDPALVSLQQYHVTSDTSTLNREKASVTAQMRQDLFGKKVKKSMMTFHSEKDREAEIDIEAGFSMDNPGLDVFLNDAKMDSSRDGTTVVSPDEPVPSNSDSQRLKQSASAASLLHLENQREAPASGNAQNAALTMVVTHHVKWEKTLEFENWTKDMFQKM